VAYNKSNWNDTTLVSIVTLMGTNSVVPGAAAVVPNHMDGMAGAPPGPRRNSHRPAHRHANALKFMSANIGPGVRSCNAKPETFSAAFSLPSRAKASRRVVAQRKRKRRREPSTFNLQLSTISEYLGCSVCTVGIVFIDFDEFPFVIQTQFL